MNPLKSILAGLLVVFMPVHAAVTTVFVLIMADLICGILAARKRKEPITSAALRRTITKILVYESALLLAFLAETYLIHGLIPVTTLVSSMIGIVELKSVYENLDTVSGGELLKSVISKLGSDNDQPK